VSDPKLITGAVDPELHAEFPGLALHWVELEASSGRSPQPVRERLKEMSNRFTGPKAVQLRQEPIPWAYRVFFRQVGIDPDERRTPVEQLALDRMKHGGFRSRNLLDDAIAIATVETGVALVAFDAERVSGPLRLRLSASHLVIADAERELSLLFSGIDPEAGVTPQTTRMLLAAVQVGGVPDISVEEALWTAAEIITGP
jgi:DNA/RNA-binding domain of Phe-tRNA-synthetase-like protein